MKAKIWGIIAIFISIAIWGWFVRTWLVVVGPNSSIWECQIGPSVLNVSSSIIYIIVVFFVPIQVISLISSIFLIRMTAAKTWGIIARISSLGMILLYMIITPSLLISACKEADFANRITFNCFMLLSVISLISSIVLIRRIQKSIEC